MGSIEAARRAGSNEAAKASISTKTAASASTSGSKGLTPNRNEPQQPGGRRQRPAILQRNPRVQALAADLKTRPRIPDRCEPKAMRIAISCARRAAENAMTL